MGTSRLVEHFHGRVCIYLQTKLENKRAADFGAWDARYKDMKLHFESERGVCARILVDRSPTPNP